MGLLMNFLRTVGLQRIADYLKLSIEGSQFLSQSNLNISGGRNIVYTQTEAKDTTTLTAQCGTGGVFGYWGSFWDSTVQTVTSTTTAYVININSSDGHDGVTVEGGNKITFANKAVYNVACSIQVTNTDTAIQDATFWYRKNGVDVANSGSRVSVPNSHGGAAGDLIFYVDLTIQANASDYVQLVWCSTSTQLSLNTIAAGTSPTRPACPSVIVTVVQV